MSRYPPGSSVGNPWDPGSSTSSVDPPKPRLQFQQVASGKLEVTWTLSKNAKSIYGSLHDQYDTKLAGINMDGDSRGVYCTLSSRSTIYTVKIKPTYWDNTSATGSIQVWTTY